MKTFFILLAVSTAVFFPSIQGHYLYWDDTTHIINNPNLVSGEWWKFWTESYYRLYIPVIYTVWSWLFLITSDPWIYHAFNILLHAANGYLFLRLARLTVPWASNTAL